MSKVVRIENEPEEVYFGDHGKPAFGSSAIKLWLDDPEMFYHQHIARDIPQPEASRAMFLGHAFEEWLFDGKEPLVADVKTAAAKAVAEMQAANPEARVIAGNEYGDFAAMVGAVPVEVLDFFRSGVVKKQVVYRRDMGPFYLQARIDAEAAFDDVPEHIRRAVDLRNGKRLLIDAKTTATLLGRQSFAKSGIWQYRYPVQEELYRWIAEGCWGQGMCEFRFYAAAKDGTGARWVRFMPMDESPEQLVRQGVADLANAMAADIWSEYREPMQVAWVPENYMRKGLE